MRCQTSRGKVMWLRKWAERHHFWLFRKNQKWNHADFKRPHTTISPKPSPFIFQSSRDHFSLTNSKIQRCKRSIIEFKVWTHRFFLLENFARDYWAFPPLDFGVSDGLMIPGPTRNGWWRFGGNRRMGSLAIRMVLSWSKVDFLRMTKNDDFRPIYGAPWPFHQKFDTSSPSTYLEE